MKNVLACLVLLLVNIQVWAAEQITQLRPVGYRGFYTTDGPYAEFNPSSENVFIEVPENDIRKPVIVYAHGGAGLREDDVRRVQMLNSNGFATISFDAYEMNGLDWKFVTRKVSNTGKQNLIFAVFKGAVDYARQGSRWDSENIFFYGSSNGGRVILSAASTINMEHVRGIMSEAPAATGLALGDITVPTILAFGRLDTWAGKSNQDFIWKRTYPNNPISIDLWYQGLQKKNLPVSYRFYNNAGHNFHEGPLTKVTKQRGHGFSFTAYQGASTETKEQYEKDVVKFIYKNIKT
ncbi:MAG: dienelactone hydrolase family protein [Aestuariibacter sp.]